MPGYIDKDALIKTTEETPFTMSMGCLTVDECNGMNRARKLLAELFKTLPTSDVAPVIHGEWRDDADKIDKRFHRHDFFCKKCNTRADYFIGGEGNWWSSYAPNYCPNCGAKMNKT